jgi:hypothetical protein
MTAHDLIGAMDKPLNDAVDLSRAVVIAMAGVDGAGFDEKETAAALDTLARFALRETERSLELWNKLQHTKIAAE